MTSSVKFIKFLKLTNSMKLSNWAELVENNVVLCSMLNESVLVENTEEMRSRLDAQNTEFSELENSLPVCFDVNISFLMNQSALLCDRQYRSLLTHGYRYQEF